MGPTISGIGTASDDEVTEKSAEESSDAESRLKVEWVAERFLDELSSENHCVSNRLQSSRDWPSSSTASGATPRNYPAIRAEGTRPREKKLPLTCEITGDGTDQPEVTDEWQREERRHVENSACCVSFL